MTEPVSATAAAAATHFGWGKIITAFTHPAFFASIGAAIVFALCPPKGFKQSLAAFALTFLGSINGGAFIIEHYNLTALSATAAGYVYLLAALPIWVVTLGFFKTMEKIGLVETIKAIRAAWKG